MKQQARIGASLRGAAMAGVLLAIGGLAVTSAQAPKNQSGKADAKGSGKTDPAPKEAPAPKPPKPGLVSCAGKIEGRYAASNGLPYTMTFRKGKVTMTAPLMGSDEVQCWTGGGKIYLHKQGEADDIEIDINDDGTLQTPFGEMKKKGA